LKHPFVCRAGHLQDAGRLLHEVHAGLHAQRQHLPAQRRIDGENSAMLCINVENSLRPQRC
jgi:hypothetical protein